MREHRLEIIIFLSLVGSLALLFIGAKEFIAAFTLLAISFWARSFNEEDLSNHAPGKGLVIAGIASCGVGVFEVHGGYLKIFSFATALSVAVYYAFIKSGIFDVPHALKNKGTVEFIEWFCCTMMISLDMVALTFMKIYGYHMRPEN